MRKFTFLLALLLTGFMSQVQSQITFADYDGTDMSFGGWDGPVAFAKVTNTFKSGINTSDNIGEISHSGGTWQGIETVEADILTTPIDFAATPFFRMKVYCSNPIEITFKLQNSPDWWTNVERKYTLSEEETNKWVELTFSFVGTDLTNMNRIALHFDGNADHSVEGTKYYFDEINASNMPPAGESTFAPAQDDTDVKVYEQLKITSNLTLRMIDDSPITDPTSVLVLKKTDANGADVPFSASISEDNLSFTIIPDAMMDPSTIYWYGIKENTLEYEIGEGVVAANGASFTTSDKSFPAISILEDFDGTSKAKLVETMGDPAPTMTSVADPDDAGNQLLQFDKGTSWGGYERLHMELTYPFEIVDGKAAFSVRVKSPKTGGFLLKLSDMKDSDSQEANSIETWADVTIADTWQTLYFEFENMDPVEYTHLFIFPLAGNGDEAVTFHIDDVKGPDTPAPVLNVNYTPGTDATNINRFGEIKLRSNYALADVGGTAITDLTGKVALRLGSSAGADVPFTASISDDGKTITFDPEGLLTLGATYWFGVLDNQLEFEVNSNLVTGMTSTFTVRSEDIVYTTYDDFNGNKSHTLIEPLGDPAGSFNVMTFDPTDFMNGVAKWSKGTTWSGWERIHLEFAQPIDFSGDKVISFRVYAPKANKVLVKVADGTDEWGANKMELTHSMSAIDEWVTFYFDFEGIDLNHNFTHLYIFCDAGVAEENDYFFDDIKGPGFRSATGLFEVEMRETLTVSPNPATDILRIANVNDGEWVEVYNAVGAQVKQVMLSNGAISVADLKTGLYFVTVNGVTSKIIKK